MNRDELLSIVEGSVFGSIPRDALHALTLLIVPLRLPAGNILFSEGDVGTEAYFVLDGEIEISRRAGGARVILNSVRRGGFMGELALYDSGLRTATARAVTATSLGALSHHQFFEMIRTWPEVATALLRANTRRFSALEEKYLAALAKKQT